MLEINSLLLAKHIDFLSIRDLSGRTINTYKSYLSQYINWVESELGSILLSDVSWEQIRSYVRYLKDIRKLNNRTINVHLAQLHDFYIYVLKKNWDRYEVPYLKFDTPLPVVPTKDEVDSIINSISNIKHKAEIALLYSSGIRIGELCNLKCGDILRSKNLIHIRKAKNRHERYAILSDKAFSHMVTYIRTMYRDATRDDWLFPRRGHKDIKICDQTIRNVFNNALSACNLSDKGFVCHSLRHAFGLHLYEAGTDILTIKEAMGHKSISSTEVYLTLGIGNGRSVASPYDL